MIAAESPPAGDPGQASFDDPSSGQRAKTGGGTVVFLCRGAFGRALLRWGVHQTPNNLGGPTQVLQEPDDHGAGIMAIAPDQFDSGELVHQWLKHASGSLLIGLVGVGDFGSQQIALRVN